MVTRQATQPHRHRSTGLKQKNKSFKSKHSTKGALKLKYKEEKVQALNLAAIQRKGKNESAYFKAQKKNHSKLIQQNKRDALKEMDRIFIGPKGAPKIIAVVPLCPDVNSLDAVRNLYKAANQDANLHEMLPNISFNTPVDVYYSNHRQNIRYIPVDREAISILDACRIADFVLFVVSAVVEVDEIGEAHLSMTKAQSIPKVLSAVQHMNQVSAKHVASTKKALSAYMEHHFPDNGKVFDLDVEAEISTCLRFITQSHPKIIIWRDRHSYMPANVVDHTVDENGTNYLHVIGHIRGSTLSPNSLVHIPNFGDFQIAGIEVIQKAVTDTKKTNSSMDTEQSMVFPDEDQELLISANDVEGLDQEQTWPTEEELRDADSRLKKLSDKKMMVPKGTSSYQAVWIEEDENKKEGNDEDEELDMQDNNAEDDISYSSEFENNNLEEVQLDNASEIRIEREDEIDDEDNMKQYEEYLEKKKDEQEDARFPDEVECPPNVLARIRFQKYRGLKSFRSSEWDPYENLPIDYARMFQFQNFRAAKKNVFSEINSDGLPVGSLVKIILKNVPRVVYEYYASTYIPLFSILRHEHKVSVMNFSITRSASYSSPVKSKDTMLLVSGFRRLIVNPIFSMDTKGSKNNTHKFVKFLQPGATCVATVYSPIQFDPAPAMLFSLNETMDGKSIIDHNSFIGCGSVLGSDTTRIIAKRIILTGHPFKCHTRSAVIRYMFHNVHDINYFKPVQLVTKHGRVGHIKESLGTRGYMKCIFDKPINQMDTVCMYLYKRVYPKWSTQLYSQVNINGEQLKIDI